MTFDRMPELPGWEGTEGRFGLDLFGRLRFVRHIRRIGDGLVYAVIVDTPRALERRIAGFAADLARADEPA